jgi:hypothetical protein
VRAAVEQDAVAISRRAPRPDRPDGAHTGGAEPTGDGFTDAEYKTLFGDDKAEAL